MVLSPTQPGVIRFTKIGSNLILEAAPKGWLDLARETLKDPMLWFLLGTSVLFAVVGQARESAILLAALVPLVGMDAYLHRRTHASIEGLSSRLASRATVVREGMRRTVPATALVPGDMVVDTTGEAFPADGLVVGGDRMQADGTITTGSTPAQFGELLLSEIQKWRRIIQQAGIAPSAG